MATAGRTPRTRTALLILAFLAITFGLTWLASLGGMTFYQQVFRAVATPIYALLGVEDVALGGRLRYMNFIPFVGLMLVTPGLSLARRSFGLLGGLLAILLSQILLNLWGVRATQYQLPVMVRLVMDGVPFLVWAFIARDTLARLGARAFAGPGPPDSR